MKLKDLYNKRINRTVNPAVSATKLDDPETIKTEIEEYVFTDEIINGLYRILDAIKNNKPYDHVGIWIDGYYGSGKSHFLKYLDYCITPSTQEKALDRLLEAVKGIDPDIAVSAADKGTDAQCSVFEGHGAVIELFRRQAEKDVISQRVFLFFDLNDHVQITQSGRNKNGRFGLFTAA